MPSLARLLLCALSVSITAVFARPSSQVGHEVEQRQTTTSAAVSEATVEVCTDINFTGQCYNATWPVSTCIDLHGYAGVTKSFKPAPGFECLLTQGKCNVAEPYADFSSSSNSTGSSGTGTTGSDLTKYAWWKEASSYICFTEVQALQRFVRMARIKAARVGEAQV